MTIPVVGALLSAPAGATSAGPAAAEDIEADNVLLSTPENVVWGGFPIDIEPGVTMGSGETVRVDTLSGSGFTNPAVTPVEYFGALGVQPEEILPDGLAFWETLPTRVSYGPHVLTGPIYVEGAEPGDTIEIEILDLDLRVPYGVNSTGPTSGVMSETYPGWREGDEPLDIVAQIPDDAPAGVLPDERQHLYRTGTHEGQDVVLFDEGIVIPQQKFMGVMAVAPPTGELIGRTEDAPPPAHGIQTSVPPGKFGGNLDVRDLTEGATLYLPVFQEGAQIFLGDAHSAQGDGEVSGTAVEHSIAGTFRVTVHKDMASDGPWAETADHWIMMGIDWDLDRAMRFAVEDTIDFLVQEKGMTEAKAYSFASINVDYKVAEVVDGTQVVTGMIPKSVFVDDVIEEPTTDEPPAEEPTTDVPATDEPTTDVPPTEAPTTGAPSAAPVDGGPTTGDPAPGGAGGAGAEPTSAGGQLPSTGAGVMTGVVAALTLLLAGAVALATRRRRVTE
ncbi:acetamidase/formamidase family protein [Georgenia sp. MJ206]|uniref:acetamidase/formamidase family protein n=1 Tax=Georgenia wangjunii TaxID=3117730 RepID=UPI002F26170F